MGDYVDADHRAAFRIENEKREANAASKAEFELGNVGDVTAHATVRKAQDSTTMDAIIQERASRAAEALDLLSERMRSLKERKANYGICELRQKLCEILKEMQEEKG